MMASVESPRIREAETKVLPRLLVLMQQLSTSGANPEVEALTPRHEAAIEELIHSPYCHLLVIEDKEQVLGTCVVYILPNLPHGAARWAVVEHVVVDETHRSLGFGERLMDEAERLAREAGAYRLSLMSHAQRDGAHRFYTRLGYRDSHVGFTKYFL